MRQDYDPNPKQKYITHNQLSCFLLMWVIFVIIMAIASYLD